MTKEAMHRLINRMHRKLNFLIESNNFDLMHVEVQKYSRMLDRVISYYNRGLEEENKDIAVR